MEIVFTEKAKSDLEHWKKSGDRQAQKRISQLIISITETPFEGIGKPELLKYALAGKWSRRITQEHRLVYQVEKERIIILSMFHHY